jgi:hypothetical protein
MRRHLCRKISQETIIISSFQSYPNKNFNIFSIGKKYCWSDNQAFQVGIIGHSRWALFPLNSTHNSTAPTAYYSLVSLVTINTITLYDYCLVQQRGKQEHHVERHQQQAGGQDSCLSLLHRSVPFSSSASRYLAVVGSTRGRSGSMLSVRMRQKNDGGAKWSKPCRSSYCQRRRSSMCQ